MILVKNSMKNLLLILFLIPFITLGQDCVEPKLPDWDKKQYTYKLIRVKLAEPILIGEGDAQRRIEYKTEAKSMSPEDVARDCKKGKKKSSGRMRKTTAKKMTRKNSKK